MSLAAGTRLGPYEIVSLLGAGGMGEVYRARDVKLGREVAIKILPNQFSGDAERVARFEREARTLAVLNHPHIAQIYGFEQSGTISALAMEYVDGEDLSKRLARGPIPVDDALSIARQIADALEAAHEQGVVHRDLKPANIQLRSDGTVKVLDFGIAKVLLRAEGSADGPTVSATGRGVLMGTAPYMSPEQTRGAEVTRRSDIWAFGAVLFEMLTGKRAFAGETASDVVATILQGSPDWAALPRQTPAAIVRLIRRCLEREPKSRLHDIGDARLEIEDVQRTLRGEKSGAEQIATLGEVAATPMWRRARLWFAGFAAVGLAVGAYVGWPGNESTGREVRLQMAPPPGMRFVSVPALSPDGSRMVFAAAADAGGASKLYLRPFDAAAEELPGSEGGSYPFWSADNHFIGFFADGKLKRVAAAGGKPVIVCDVAVGRGGLWLEDDTIVFAPSGNSPLLRVNAAGGSPAPFTGLAEDEISHRFPQRLPGRQLLYFAVNRVPDKSGTRLVTIDEPHRTISYTISRGAAEYVRGFLIYVPFAIGSSAPVLAQRMTLPEGQLTGEPVEIGQTRISETLGRHAMATAPAGAIAMLGPVEGTGQFTWLSRDGRQLDTVGVPVSQFGVELSPDGLQMATVRANELWTLDLARPVATRVTPGPHRHPIWSPDGASISSLFQGRGLGSFDLVTTPLATGIDRTVRQHNSMVKPVGWLQDGRLVWIEAAAGGQREFSIWTKPASGPPALFLRDASLILEARVSRDQRWIAYASDRSGRFEIEVSSLAEPGRRFPVSVEGGGYPRWRADGRELYFLAADGRLMAASFKAGTPPMVGTPVPLFEVRLIAHPDRATFAAFEYDVNADGSRFLINRMISPPDPNMTVIVDWDPPR